MTVFVKRWVHAKKQEHSRLSWDVPKMPVVQSAGVAKTREFPLPPQNPQSPEPQGQRTSLQALTEDCFLLRDTEWDG